MLLNRGGDLLLGGDNEFLFRLLYRGGGDPLPLLLRGENEVDLCRFILGDVENELLLCRFTLCMGGGGDLLLGRDNELFLRRFGGDQPRRPDIIRCGFISTL